MKWTDVQEIAIELSERHPDVDPKTIRFTDLRAWVLALEAGPERSVAHEHESHVVVAGQAGESVQTLLEGEAPAVADDRSPVG